MIALLTLAKTYWKPLAAVGVVLALWGLLLAYGAHERHVQAQADKIALEDVQSQLRTCQANTRGLQASIATQNAATDALKADSDRRAKVLADGLSEARKGRASAEARAAGLLRPVLGVDACARAVAAREAVLGSLQP